LIAIMTEGLSVRKRLGITRKSEPGESAETLDALDKRS